MITKVIKRDGRKAVYAFEKVSSAVTRAFAARNQEPTQKFIEQLKEEIDKEFVSNDPDVPVNIEDIQDVIRNFLIKKNKFDIAEAFILYRYKRNRAREQKSQLIKSIKEKLEAKNIQNQNANVDEMSFGGRIGEASRVITKELALYHCMSELSRNNHLNNQIYIHDIDSYVIGNHNCLTIPFDDLLANGFITRQTDVRPANSINTAMQLIAVIFQLQSLQQFGGVSAGHIDWTMVPYVRKSFYKHFKTGSVYIEEIDSLDDYNDSLSIDDKLYMKYPKLYKYAMDMTIKECYQAVEGMYHNLNTLQ